MEPSRRPRPSYSRAQMRRTLALLIDYLRDPYQNAVFVAVDDAARENDAHLIAVTGGIIGSPDPSWSQRTVLYDMIGPHNVQALIVASGTMGVALGPARLARYLERYRPLTVVSTAYELEGWPSVVVDNERGMRTILEHLVVAHGRRRIAFIRGPEANQEAERRFAIYRQVLAEHGLSFDPALVCQGTFLRPSGVAAANDLVDRGVRFDALAAANDMMALGAMWVLRSRGLRLPDDVVVVGFDDIYEGRFAVPSLTTVRQPYRELGRTAVRLALEGIAGERAPRWVSLPAELVRRRSCGCVAGEDPDRADGPEDSLPPGEQDARTRLALLALSETSRALSATQDLPSLNRTLVAQLPRLEIPACALSLYERRLEPLAGARLEVVYDTGRAPLPASGSVFETGQLAPGGLFAGDRRTYVLEPLFFGREQFGFFAMQAGPREGLVYEALRDQISGALQSVRLMEAVLDEAKRRQIAERDHAEKEMKIAARIQTMILPRGPAAPGLAIAATMVPASNVGGDYYDVLPADGGCWLGIGDVAGHGLVSGLVMLMIQSAVTGLIRQQPDIRPADVVRAVNAVLFENVRSRLGQSEHATFCIMRYRVDGSLEFAGAHEDILVLRHRTGRCERIPTEGTWLGMIPDLGDTARDHALRLEDGDLLVLFSDGLLEARDLKGTLYGVDRLAHELERCRDLTVVRIRDEILAAVGRWMVRQDDDLTLLVARYRRP